MHSFVIICCLVELLYSFYHRRYITEHHNFKTKVLKYLFMVAGPNVIPFGQGPAMVVKTQGLSPEGKPIMYDQKWPWAEAWS